MNNVIIGMNKERTMRFYLVDTTKICEELTQINQSSPIGSSILGQVAGITGLISLMQKDAPKVSSIIQGSGESGKIIATSENGKVRALITNPFIGNGDHLINLPKYIGLPGTLIVTKDMGLKEPYVSQVELVSGNIAKDFSYYFTVSEQLPTAILSGAPNSLKNNGTTA